MQENARISIDQSSVMNINSDAILETDCNTCLGIHFDVSGELNINDTPFSLSENSTLNITSTGVVNINSTAGLCLNSNTQINIANGGKIYKNGLDYTTMLNNGYANVYDTYFNNQTVTGSHYALNKIETSGNVQTQGFTQLKAGRRIVFKPGFVGKPGLTAQIDANLNNCEETPCVNQGSSLRIGSSGGGNKKGTENTHPPIAKTQKELAKEVLISVYPNPNEGVFTLKIDGIANEKALDFNVEIYNTLGVTVFNTQIKALKKEINVSNLPKGIYHVRVGHATMQLGEAIIIR